MQRILGGLFFAFYSFLLPPTHGFHSLLLSRRRTPLTPVGSHSNSLQHTSTEQATDNDVDSSSSYDTSVASQFKVVTCSASACAAKRKVLGLDEFATFSGLYVKAKQSMPEIVVEESSCLGACKKAPCVGVQHEEFVGTVALDGMDTFEFTDRVFHRVIDDGDTERVWNCIENAVAFMATGESNEE